MVLCCLQWFGVWAIIRAVLLEKGVVDALSLHHCCVVHIDVVGWKPMKSAYPGAAMLIRSRRLLYGVTIMFHCSRGCAGSKPWMPVHACVVQCGFVIGSCCAV